MLLALHSPIVPAVKTAGALPSELRVGRVPMWLFPVLTVGAAGEWKTSSKALHSPAALAVKTTGALPNAFQTHWREPRDFTGRGGGSKRGAR